MCILLLIWIISWTFFEKVNIHWENRLFFTIQTALFGIFFSILQKLHVSIFFLGDSTLSVVSQSREIKDVRAVFREKIDLENAKSCDLHQTLKHFLSLNMSTCSLIFFYFELIIIRFFYLYFFLSIFYY